MGSARGCRVRLVALDVDGVVVPVRSSWGYIHEVLGTTEDSELNYSLFRSGLIGYWEWMYLDTLAWVEAKPGITRWELEEIFNQIPINSDAKKAVEILRKAGLEIALVSGGVDILVSRVARELGIKHWISPALVFDPWGRLVPGGEPRLEADRKDKAVLRLAKKLGYTMRQVAFVGDSKWDLRGMREACLAIAVNPADSEVIREADYVARNLVEAAEFIVKHA
ncbi:HAD-IB family phosphatase [Hyperthermus butylicus]|uniref:phosphoserine phosphatase n=1 Tax=Hyperthermus butylicus (strain DSM 5456 / JCM 9403 / PLM1-5) TaxID=415426 RepID=A2BJU7_HYPBU|nr:HAD-IB family phosphatase [Hyperthermus butylicus]ABM80258.1 putative phosphoserine phosphatase, SerB [Hyperthermus butylicus DSM 5456]